MAESIWFETGRKADIGTGKENFCLDAGNHLERKNTGTSVAVAIDKQKRANDDAREDSTTVATTTVATTAVATADAATIPTTNVVVEDTAPFLPSSDDDEEEVEVVAKKRIILAPTLLMLKRSHSQASTSDFLEAFHASILHDEERRERGHQDRLDALAQERLNRKEDGKAVIDALAAIAGGFAKAFMDLQKP